MPCESVMLNGRNSKLFLCNPSAEHLRHMTDPPEMRDVFVFAAARTRHDRSARWFIPGNRDNEQIIIIRAPGRRAGRVGAFSHNLL
jgi:hypothetical protein